MADEDELVVIATYLRPEEAGMLRGVLESAGIVAVVRDEMLSSVNPLLQSAIGGAKLAVRVADEQRARELIKAAGALPGSPEEPIEIPEEEWSRSGDGQPSQPTTSRQPVGRLRRAIVAALRFVIGA